MPLPEIAGSAERRLNLRAAALAVGWTVAVATSWAWNVYQAKALMLEMARAEARGAYNKDLIFRRWVANNGGVYVPVTPRTPPNPYLAGVVAERDVVTPSGRRLTLVNPAYMTRQVHELGAKSFGLRGHITSLNPIRPENAPDNWEREALSRFERGATEVSSVEQLEGAPYLRLMRPLLTETNCLQCHAKQGYREGDVRGGISVTVALAPHAALISHNLWALGLGHASVWLLGLLGLAANTARLVARQAERDEARRKLQEQHDHLEQLVAWRTNELQERNREIEQFVDIVSHDLRSPLVSVEGFAAELRHSVTEARGVVEASTSLTSEERDRLAPLLAEDMTECLDFVEVAANRMKGLIEAILKLSRTGRHELVLEPLDMTAVATTVVEAFAHQVSEAGAEVALAELPPVVADRLSMEQVVANLVGNALKYLDPARPGRIEIGGQVADDEVVFHVRDNGRGIDAAYTDRLFAPFRRAGHEDVPGEGLGLAFVQTVLRRHGGRIWFESEEGVGTTFFFSLPTGKRHTSKHNEREGRP